MFANAYTTIAKLKRHKIPVMILRGMLTMSYLSALPMVTQISTRKIKVVKRKFSIHVLIWSGVSARVIVIEVGESSSLFKRDRKKIEDVP